jgi:CRP-like cAMP-binding protein
MYHSPDRDPSSAVAMTQVTILAISLGEMMEIVDGRPRLLERLKAETALSEERHHACAVEAADAISR